MRLQLTALPLLLFACATTPKAPAEVAVGDTVDFTLMDLKGDRISPADLAGEVVLVDLWATWCKPCEESLPFYAELAERHRGDGFRVVAISVDEEEDAVFDYVEKNPMPSFIVLRDPKGTVPRKIGIATLPTMLILGRDGRVAYVHAGFQDEDRTPIATAVEQALALAVEPGAAPKQ